MQAKRMQALEQTNYEEWWGQDEAKSEWLVLDAEGDIVIHNTTEYRARLIAQRLSD